MNINDRLGSARQQPQSIVVDKIGSSYYALPAARSNAGQEARLHALLPAAEADGSPPLLDAWQAEEDVEGQVGLSTLCPPDECNLDGDGNKDCGGTA